MSDRNDTEQDTEQDHRQDEQDGVTGVDTDAGGDTSISVDTHERLSAKEEEPDLEDIPTEDLEQERQERLDPDNRPDNVEVDNSQRTFDPETGLFEDSDVEAPAEAPFSTVEGEKAAAAGQESSPTKEPKDQEEAPDAEESKEATESRDTEG